MTEVNRYSVLKPSDFGILIKPEKSENKNTATISLLGISDSILLTGTKQLKTANPFDNKTKTDITQTKNFKSVFPNFAILDKDKQDIILKKLELFEKKYPGFVDKLAKIDNPKFGDGFQFFFVPEKNDPKYNESPGIGMIDKAMGNSAIGVVFAGTAGVLENSILKTPVARISHSVLNTDLIKYKGDKVNLDVGGMFTSSDENTFDHEMGHVLHGYFLNNSERGELWSIYIKTGENDKFITDYSKTNHMEFFGEGIEEYLKQDSAGNFIGREDFKKKNPEFYNFVARVIDPDLTRGKTQSKLESLKIISGYGLENTKKYLSEKWASLTK